jgi:trehalose utilization protein
MPHPASRRDFLAASAALLASPTLPRRAPTKVVVWDERQPAQKQAYEHFLGNAIAAHLRALPGVEVQSVGLDDPGQGVTDDVLGDARVLVWWGHVRQGEVKPEVGRRIVERIKAGTLALVALHSAHWSTPFMEAMNERSRLDAAKSAPAGAEVHEVPPPQRQTLPKRDNRVTPYVEPRKFPDGTAKLDLHLPFCCFPAYRTDGKPSQVRVLRPDHPIAEGLPTSFEIPQEEMYDEPFHVPEPDQVIFEERWPTGEWFRSGMVWTIGKGRVFYFRPGHETFPVYKQAFPLRVVANAVRWLASNPN